MLGRIRDGLAALPLASDDEYAWPLYQHGLERLAVICTASCYVWLFVSWTQALAHAAVPSLRAILTPTLAVATAGLALLLRRKPIAAAAVLVGGLIAALYSSASPARYLLAPALVCLAGFLMGRRFAYAAAAGLTFLPGLPAAGVASLWLTAITFALASGYMRAALVQAQQRQRAALRLEQELLTRRGELRRLNDSLSLAYSLLERTNHELAEARDEAEEARRLKMQFAATISHELRTPLNLILGFSEVMYKTPESYDGAVLPAELRGDIREIYQSTRHLLALVDDVLDLSRIEQVRLAFMPEDTDIAALVHEAATTVAGLFRGKPVQLRVELAHPLPHCVLDRTRIRQVLINLLANAARFTEQGEVCVRAMSDPAREEVSISVTDTGPGISEEEQPRIFDPFYQIGRPLRRRHEGTGLGLAICRTFVQMHGGRIWCESKVGVGSCFTFTLPIHARLQPLSSESRRLNQPDPFGDSIVVLDRSSHTASLLERSLSQLKVHKAEDVDQAREMVARWHPKAIVAISGEGEQDSAGEVGEALPWPGLPVLHCRLLDRKPLRSYANVRSVLSKPVTSEALLLALSGLGQLQSLLIVDDDEGMARLVQRTIASAWPEIRVYSALDGRQALALLRQQRPSAVLLDLAMPELDGLSVIRAMAEEGLGDVPVLVLTAMDLNDEGQAGIMQDLVVTSRLGLGSADLVRYVEAIAQAARPRYVGSVASWGSAQGGQAMPVAAS